MLNSFSMYAMREELVKLAKPESVTEDALGQQEEQPMPTHPLVTAAKNLGAYGVGTGVGYGGSMAADALLKKYTGQGVNRVAMHALPVATGLAGIGFRYAQDSTFNKMRQDAAERRARGSQKP